MLPAVVGGHKQCASVKHHIPADVWRSAGASWELYMYLNASHNLLLELCNSMHILLGQGMLSAQITGLYAVKSVLACTTMPVSFDC